MDNEGEIGVIHISKNIWKLGCRLGVVVLISNKPNFKFRRCVGFETEAQLVSRETARTKLALRIANDVSMEPLYGKIIGLD